MFKPPSKSKFATYYEKYMIVVGVLGQLVFYAQAFKIFTDRAAKDVSLFGFSCGLISVSSWLIYGILFRDRVVTIANAVAVVGALLVVLGILIYGF